MSATRRTRGKMLSDNYCYARQGPVTEHDHAKVKDTCSPLSDETVPS